MIYLFIIVCVIIFSIMINIHTSPTIPSDKDDKIIAYGFGVEDGEMDAADETYDEYKQAECPYTQIDLRSAWIDGYNDGYFGYGD